MRRIFFLTAWWILGFGLVLGLGLQAAEPRQIIARMLRNLHEIYRRQDDQERLLKVRARLALLLPEN